MRRIHVITVFALVTLGFLSMQIFFMKYVSKQRKDDDKSDQLKHENSGQSLTNVKVFIELCTKEDIPVFLIDPIILDGVMNNGSQSEACKYLCRSGSLTTFAVINTHWTKQGYIVGELRNKGFHVAEVYDVDPRLLTVDSMSAMQVATHCVMTRQGHTIHLVVFYERSGNYWWHAQLGSHNLVKGDTTFVHVSNLHLRFGKYAGAYDKMEILKVEMDGLKLHAPRYPIPFLKQIAHSRFIECNHTRAKHFYSKYKRDSSAQAQGFREKARQVLAAGKKTLDQLDIRFWMSSGTCLGWYRQCDIIPYSKDVDFGIWIKDYDVRLIPAMEMTGLPIKHIFGKETDSFELSFKGGDVKLDIFFFYEESDIMWNGGTQARTGKKFKYLFPKFTLCWTEFLDLKIRIPCETQSYIEANYGKRWFVPVKRWDWKHSPPNVRENGKWPRQEWNRVIQMYQ